MKIPGRKPKCFSDKARVFAASAGPPSPFCRVPGVVDAMETGQVDVMAAMARHRRLYFAASRMRSQPDTVAFGNEPCAGSSRCRIGSGLRKARSGKDRNEASEGE